MESVSSATAYSRSKPIEEYAGVEDIDADMETLTQENFVLTQTAEVLERYLRKRSPAMLIGLDRCIERTSRSMRSSQTGRSMSIGSTTGSHSPSPAETVVRSSTTSSVMRGLVTRSNARSSCSYKINSAAKADLVEREVEESKITIEKLQKRFESAKFLLQTEEENLRIDILFLEESKIALEDFISQNTDSKSCKISYDKFLRFLERELKTGDQNLRKLKLKTKSLHTEYKRLLSQQQQKMELTERLHPIDIEKLLIENEEQLDFMEMRNKKLQDLKKVVGRKGQTLVSFKSALNDTILSLKNVKHDFEQTKVKCKCTEKQEEENLEQLKIAENINQNIKNLNTAFKSPNIHSYLQVQSKLQELKSEKEAWERRCKYQNQQISLLEHQVKQLSSTPRSRGYSWRKRSSASPLLATGLQLGEQPTPRSDDR